MRIFPAIAGVSTSPMKTLFAPSRLNHRDIELLVFVWLGFSVHRMRLFGRKYLFTRWLSNLGAV